VRELSSPRVDQSARCPVRELAIRELAYPRVVQLPPSIGPKSLYLRTPLVFNSPAEGFPWDDLREIISGCQCLAKVPNAVEILPKI